MGDPPNRQLAFIRNEHPIVSASQVKPYADLVLFSKDPIIDEVDVTDKIFVRKGFVFLPELQDAEYSVWHVWKNRWGTGVGDVFMVDLSSLDIDTRLFLKLKYNINKVGFIDPQV